MSEFIPKKFNIYGKTYKIVIVPEDSIDDAEGQIHFKKKSIELEEIDTGDAEKVLDQLATFWHEVGHGTFRRLSYDHSVSDDLEHVIVDTNGKLFREYMRWLLVETLGLL